MLTFNQKKELEILYSRWFENLTDEEYDNLDNDFNIIGYLSKNGLLNEEKVQEFLNSEITILSAFEELGFDIIENDLKQLILQKGMVSIHIFKDIKKFSYRDEDNYPACFDMEELSLLNELFKFWGWIE